jgi:hypothetical protein
VLFLKKIYEILGFLIGSTIESLKDLTLENSQMADVFEGR